MIITGVASLSREVYRFLDTLRYYYSDKVELFLSEATECEARNIVDIFYASVSQFECPKEAWTIETEKLCWRWTLLKKLFQDNPEEVILVTDIGDVVFQGKIKEPVLGDKEILLCGENKKFKDCSTNTNWIKKSPNCPDWYKDQEIVSAGTIIGRGKDLFEIAKSLEECRYKSGSDQSELQLFIWEHPEYKWKIDTELWTAVHDNFGGVDGKGLILNNNYKSTPIIHAQGKSKKILNKLYILDKQTTDGRMDQLEMKLNTILNILLK